MGYNESQHWNRRKALRKESHSSKARILNGLPGSMCSLMLHISLVTICFRKWHSTSNSNPACLSQDHTNGITPATVCSFSAAVSHQYNETSYLLIKFTLDLETIHAEHVRQKMKGRRSLELGSFYFQRNKRPLMGCDLRCVLERLVWKQL